MFSRKFIVALLLITTVTAKSQNNFIYTPEKPKPGDKITLTYEPAGDIANTIKPVEGVVYQMGKRANKADDIVLERKAGVYTGTITTDTAMNFLYFGFTADKKFDNNFNEGYYIQLYENDKPRDGSFMAKANLYQYAGRQVGIDVNNEKALEAYDKEFESFPDNKKNYLYSFIRLLTQIKKDDAQKIVQNEIESLLKTGLKEEVDYSNLENLYMLAKLPEQQKFVINVKKEKFPNGRWMISETLQKYNQEKDIDKKKQMLKDIIAKTETDENWKGVKQSLGYYKTQIPRAYLTNKDYE